MVFHNAACRNRLSNRCGRIGRGPGSCSVPHPGYSQLVMTLTPRSCYNLERNQRFNSPYESGSLLIVYLETNQREESQKEPSMEFTVSRADLVRELNLSQGVVEKKTTIPILSNVLVEADGDRIHLTATDLELGIRCSCAGAREEVRCGNDSSAPSAGLRAPAAGCRRAGEDSGEPLGESGVRAVEDAHRRNVARKFSGTAGDAGSAGGDSDRRAGRR